MAALPRRAVAFGLNRLDLRTPARFAEDARRLEALGWRYGFIPSSPLLVQDPYVLLAHALEATEDIILGPLIENPVMRHPAVIAGSIATVDRLRPGRTLLGMGVGDTAVRLMGKRPATVAELERAVTTIRALNRGERLDVAAARPARLNHAAAVPVWIAAQGPKTLRMAGRVADGVFIRVGVHPENLRLAVDAVRAGERDAGRPAGEVRIGCVFHTVFGDDADRVGRIARAVAAGYYEYSPALFANLGLPWNGEDVATLKRQVWPDFHHARDMEAAGRLVDFLPDAAMHAFALHGPFAAIREQLLAILDLDLPIEIVMPHPVPTPAPGEGDYAREFAEQVIERLPSRNAQGTLGAHTLKESTQPASVVVADRITANPQQCGGRPCIRGMRIRVIDVLDLLAAGLSPEAILDEMPDLEAEDITASIQFARRRIDPQP